MILPAVKDFLRNGKLLTLMLGHLTVDSYVGVIPVLYPILIGRFQLSLATVGLVSLAGGQKPGVRIRANPTALAAYGLNVDDLRTTISNANVNTPKGNFDGPARSYTINANDQVTDPATFRDIVVAYRNGAPVRVSDVATVAEAQENNRLAAWMNSTQAVIVPIWRKPDEGGKVMAAARAMFDSLEKANIRVRLDEREGLTPGFKFNDWEMRGVPVRIEIGPRDVASGEAVLARRDKSGPDAKSKASMTAIAETVSAMLAEIQASLYTQAKTAMVANTRKFDDYDALKKHMEGEGGGGFADIYWCGNPACETRIREETKATCRAIPLEQHTQPGKCLVCGEPAAERAFFAKSY